MLVRKQCENPTNYFDKTFAEYQEGFSANGEFQKDDEMTKTWFFQERSGSAWTSFTNWPLNVLTRWWSSWPTTTARSRAVYEQFEVITIKSWFNEICLFTFDDYLINLLKGSSHRLVQRTAMYWQWESSTSPSQPLETPSWLAGGISMGWISAPSKSNFDTIRKSSEWN